MVTAFIYLSVPIVTKYLTDPTITTVMVFLSLISMIFFIDCFSQIATTDFPIWNIDFPGITVCSNVKATSKKYDQAMRSKKMP